MIFADTVNVHYNSIYVFFVPILLYCQKIHMSIGIERTAFSREEACFLQIKAAYARFIA